MKRKMLSIIVALAMVLSMLPVMAWAAETGLEEAAAVETTSDDEKTAEPAAAKAQALIGALPSVEEVAAMDMDGQRAAYSQTQAAYDAYQELSGEDRAEITGLDNIYALFAFFNGQIAPLAVGNTNAGGLDVTPETGWTHSGSSLTINRSGDYTITSYGLQTSTQIDFDAGFVGTVTLKDVNIHARYAAMNIKGNANVTLMLEGNNELYSGDMWNAGIEMNDSNGNLTIGSTSNGSLTAKGGSNNAAGIGGGGGSGGGNITITGGNITAIGGGSGAGIGGGGLNYSGNITISGGTVTATGGIGGGSSGNGHFSTGDNGNAVIHGEIKDKSDRNNWNAIVFEGNEGTVYGDVKLDGDLTIESGESLTVPESATLTNNGTITNRGRIDGSITNNGTIVNEGGMLPPGMEATSTVSPPTAKTGLTYDGSEQKLVTAGTIDPSGDAKLLYCVNGGTYSADVPAKKNAGEYNIEYKVDGKGIFDAPAASPIHVSIVQKALEVTGATVAGRSYEPGNDRVTVTGVTLEGVVSGDDVHVDYSAAIGQMSDANAGTGKTVTVTGYTLAGSSAGNYTLTQQSFRTTVDIEKAGQAAPEVAVTVEKSTDYITFTNPIGDTYEYSIGDDKWQDNVQFTGLTPGQKYHVQVRLKGDTNYNASAAVEKDVTTVGGDGSTTVESGETAVTENGTVANNGENITVEDRNGNTTTVTPAPAGGAQVDGDGNVTVPKGGKVKIGSGPEMTLPEGGSVTGGGTVTADEIEVGGTHITGDDVTAGADGSVSVPEGGSVTPENGPEMTLPEGGTVDGGGNVTLPEGGSAQVGDTTVTVPEDGGTLRPDGKGGVGVPGGSTVTPDGGPDIIVGEQGGSVDEGGNVTLPEGGSAEVNGNTVDAPKGGTIGPDGNGGVTLPGDSTVTDAEGNETHVPPQGGKLDGDGNYTANTEPSTPGTSGGNNGGSSGGSNGGGSGGGNYSSGSDYGDYDSGNSGSNGGGSSSANPPAGSNPGHTSGDGTGSPSSTFSDLNPNAWYHEAVDYVIGNGLMNGYGNGTFGPDDTLSRAMLAQALYNQMGRPSMSGNASFTDVSSNAWYTDAVTWAAVNGIISGYGNEIFGPDDPITREQLAVMLYRFAQSQGNALTGEWRQLDYSDTEQISEYALEAVAWCTMNGILDGYDNGSLRPKGQATRAEAAVMLMRFVSRVDIESFTITR